MKKILIKNTEINVDGIGDFDFISLTDIAKIKNELDPNSIIANWLRRVDTIKFLSTLETLNNRDFKPIEGFKTKFMENVFT